MSWYKYNYLGLNILIKDKSLLKIEWVKNQLAQNPTSTSSITSY